MENNTQYTRCPHCKTAFKVSDKMMAMAKGKVRCGACLAVFQATDYLLAAKSAQPEPLSTEPAVDRPVTSDSPLTSEADLSKQAEQQASAHQDRQPTIENQPETETQSKADFASDPTLDNEQDLDFNLDAIDDKAVTDLIEPTFSEPAEIIEQADQLQLDDEIDCVDEMASDFELANDFDDEVVLEENFLEEAEHDETLHQETLHQETLDPETLDPELVLEENVLEERQVEQTEHTEIAQEQPEVNRESASQQDDLTTIDDDLLLDDESIDDFVLESLESEVNLTDAEGFEASQSQLDQMQSNHSLEDELEHVETIEPESIEQESIEQESIELESIELESIEPELTELELTEAFDDSNMSQSDLAQTDLDQSDLDLTDRAELELDGKAVLEQTGAQVEDFMATDEPSELETLIDEQQDFEALADTLAEQINDTDTTPDPLDEFEERVVDKKTTLRTLVISSVILIVLCLLSVKFWQNRQALSWDSTWGGATKAVCSVLPCDLKPRRDVDKIKLRQKVVSPSDSKEDSLDIKLLLTNDAQFDQPYPRITIKFSNSKGEVVSTQQYAVSDYFPDQQDKMMPAGSEVHIHFAADFPHPDALGFEFIFD